MFKMSKIVKLLICLAIYFASISVQAQDVLTKKDGIDIQAKVLEVTTTEVKYKKFDNLNGPTFTLLKSELLMVRYENGTKDIFNQTNTSNVVSNNTMNDDNACINGKQDANKNYTGQSSGAGWTCATTILFSPLIGVIPAAVCSSSEPSDDNLKYPNPNLMKDYNYSKCYKEQAHKTKKQKVWRNFGIGSGVWLLIIVLAGL